MTVQLFKKGARGQVYSVLAVVEATMGRIGKWIIIPNLIS